MDEQTGAELGLEPGALGGHDAAGVGHGDELAHGDRPHGEGDRPPSRIDHLFHLAFAARAAGEIDAGIGADVLDAQDGAQDVLGEHHVVDRALRFAAIDGIRGQADPVPLTAQIDAEAAVALELGPGGLLDRADLG